MAGMGGLGAALSGLSNMYPGYKQGEMDEFKIDDARRGELAKVAMGNALKMLGGGSQQGGGQPGGPLPAMPPPQPPQQPQPSPGGASAPPGPGGMPPRPGGGMPPGGGQPPAMGAPAPPQMQRPGMIPGGAPAQGGMPGMGQQGPGQGGQQPMDWRQIVAAIQQSNPNLPPDVMAEAVNQFLPMMNANSQQEWRMLSLQIREQALQQREQQFMLADRTRREEGAANRDSREGIAETTTSSRERVASANRDEKKHEFEVREQRLDESLKLREDSTWARLEQQKQQAAQRAQQAQGKQGLAELRAIIDAQDKHVRTRIQAYSSANNLTPKERKALLDQADMDYNEQIAQTPEEAKKLPPGTHYKTPDGQEYVR